MSHPTRTAAATTPCNWCRGRRCSRTSRDLGLCVDAPPEQLWQISVGLCRCTCAHAIWCFLWLETGVRWEPYESLILLPRPPVWVGRPLVRSRNLDASTRGHDPLVRYFRPPGINGLLEARVQLAQVLARWSIQHNPYSASVPAYSFRFKIAQADRPSSVSMHRVWRKAACLTAWTSRCDCATGLRAWKRADAQDPRRAGSQTARGCSIRLAHLRKTCITSACNDTS